MGEFEWIEEIKRKFEGLVPEGSQGIGDDCAVIPLGNGSSLVVTTDMLVEDVHFIQQQISAENLGHKALAVNLSDVAAMGARPVGSFLSIGLPKHLDEKWRSSFIDGYKKLSVLYQVPLLGGDTTLSEKLVINVTAIGRIETKNLKQRSRAQVGDRICVTGNLGDSATGLRLLAEQKLLPNALAQAHFCPKPYVNEGVWLGEQDEVNAMMDVSDGIASDLIHILRASQKKAQIELAELPMSGEMENVCRKHDWNANEIAVTGGEDYVLLFTVKEDRFDNLNNRYRSEFNQNLVPIGQIKEGVPSIEWIEKGGLINLDWKGFTHF